MDKMINALFSRRFFILAVLFCASTSSYAAYQLPGHFFVQAGGYSSNQGKAQDININSLIGDQYTVSNHHDTNFVFGVGYLQNGLTRGNFGLDYGINALYFAKTKVSGGIIQEHLFHNLNYNYYVSHLPIYLMLKGWYNTSMPNVTVALDLGVGPNFMETSGFSDTPTNSNTLSDNAFHGNSTVTFSSMIGVGVKKVFHDQYPVELSYHFYSLGEGFLNPNSSQVLNQLKTGNNYAQAVMLTLSV